MFRKATIIIICMILLWQAFGFFNDAEAQAKDRAKKTESFWTKFWNWTKNHTFLFSIITVTFITVISTMLTMLRKDKILKGLSGHLMTIELKGNQPDGDGSRYRGRLRVESEGLEVVEEKASKSNEKISYLIRKDEFSNIHALIRYHDLLTDKEKIDREEEVRKVYHPSIGMRLRRKMRNIVNEMRRVATEAFSLIFGKVRERFLSYGKELEAKGQEIVTYATEATYDALIDRLIGTRVVVRVKDNLEYIGVLKDYTSSFIELLNVDYKNSWQATLKKDDNFSDNVRGLDMRRDGDDLVIRSKSPFPVKLRHIYWREDKPDTKRENLNKVIEPFSEFRINVVPPALDIVVSPFEKLQLPTRYSPQNYKKIIIVFESVRVADVVLLKNYGLIRHRTEKFDAKILDFSLMADALLASKDEKLVVKGNPSATALTIYNGYLTNLPKERMDFAAINEQLGQRWGVESFFAALDKKLRPVSDHYLFKFLPLKKYRKTIALFALLTIINSDEKRKKDPLLPLIYFALCKTSTRKRRRSYRKRVVIKKKKRLLGLIPRHFHT